MPNFDEAIRAAEERLANKKASADQSEKILQETKDEKQLEGFDSKMSTRENKPIIWKAILFTVPCLLTFFMTRTLSAYLIVLAGVIISKIPILGNLLDFTFAVRNDDLPAFATILSIITAYCMTTIVQCKMMKDTLTNTFSSRILGIVIAFVHLYWLIVNISEGGNYPVNIFCIIASLAFIFINKEEY